MTPQPVKKPGSGQLNLNTFLLASCVALSSWALKSINDLQNQLSGLVPIVNTQGSAIIGINAVNADQTNRIDDAATRLTKLETIQLDHSKNKN